MLNFLFLHAFQTERSVHELQASLVERESKVSALEEELEQLRDEMKQQKEAVRTHTLFSSYIGDF